MALKSTQLSVGLTVIVSLSAAETTLAQLYPLPAGPGRRISSVVELSSDGAYVGGTSATPLPNFVPNGFVWNAASGRVDMIGSGFPSASEATDLSFDGSTLVGIVRNGGFTDAFRWTTEGTYQNIGRPAGWSGVTPLSNTNGLSIIATASQSASPDKDIYRWTQATGLWSQVSIAPTSVTEATDLTPDGQVIVGNWDQDGSGVTDTPFLYREGVGRLDLPMVAGLPQPRLHKAAAINASGTIVVGSRLQNGSSINDQPVVWQNGVATDLPLLAGATSIRATDVSDDGSIVVGLGSASAFDVDAFVWTSATSTITLRAFLLGYGIDFSENVNMQKILVSGDGSAIAGSYSIPNDSSYGFVAYIPSPATSIVFGGILAHVSRRRRR